MSDESFYAVARERRFAPLSGRPAPAPPAIPAHPCAAHPPVPASIVLPSSSMIALVLRALRQSFVWRGRSAPAEFWSASLAKLLADLGALALPGPLGLLAGAVALALLPMTLSVSVRRLHDRGRSARLLLAFLATSALLLGALAFTALNLVVPPLVTDPSAVFLAFARGALLLELLALLWLALLAWLVVSLSRPGDPGPNRYGPPPAP